MRMYIIRHGVTTWNALKKVQGSADIPLAAEGIRLAKKTGEALRNVPFDICFSSPLQRAVETARLVLGLSEVPVITDSRLREINFGVLEGIRFKDDDGKILNEELKTFFTDPWNFRRPENGENIPDIVARTRGFWEEKIHDPSLRNKNVLIASHGCAVRALLQNIYQNHEDFWHGGPPPNCSVNLVEVQEGKAVLLEEDKVYY